jgi:hypothetical protein
MGNASFSKVIRFTPSRTHIANMPIDGGESDLDLGNYERYITLLYPVPSGF